MAIVGGFDLHRRQITFDYLDTESGEVCGGRIVAADREHLRLWLRRFDSRETEFAVEACTGWRFVVEELERVGAVVHLAEPADTAALRGRKRRAKTDRVDARHLRDLVLAARVPESWIPPPHVSEARTRIRLYKALVDERTGWLQRTHAVLFHNGAPTAPGLARARARARFDLSPLPEAARAVVEVALALGRSDQRRAHPDSSRADPAGASQAQSGGSRSIVLALVSGIWYSRARVKQQSGASTRSAAGEQRATHRRRNPLRGQTANGHRRIHLERQIGVLTPFKQREGRDASQRSGNAR
jgi:Transposase